MQVNNQPVNQAQNIGGGPGGVALPLQAPGQFLPGAAGNAGGGGPSPLLNKTLAELSAEEFGQIGAGSSLENLANLQGDLTLGEVAPLLRNPIALDSIIGLMEQRPDLQIGDFISKDINGRVSIDPSYKSGETMEFLQERPDVTPQEVSRMRDGFTRLFRDPLMGKWATEMGFDLMRQRPDLKPEDMTRMMETFSRAAGMGDKGQGGNMPGSGSAGATLDMFESASRLLVKREDMRPERLGRLALSVGTLASPDDPDRGQRVAEGFDASITALESNPLRQPEEFSQLAGVIGSHFKGKDENSSAIRMNAFSQSARMMGENPEISPESINSVLTSAKGRDPKNNQPRALGNALTGVFDGVNQGLVPGSDLTSSFRAPAPTRLGPDGRPLPGATAEQQQAPGTGVPDTGASGVGVPGAGVFDPGAPSGNAPGTTRRR